MQQLGALPRRQGNSFVIYFPYLSFVSFYKDSFLNPERNSEGSFDDNKPSLQIPNLYTS